MSGSRYRAGRHHCSFCPGAQPTNLYLHDHYGGLYGYICAICESKIKFMPQQECDDLITQRLVTQRLTQGD